MLSINKNDLSALIKSDFDRFGWFTFPYGAMEMKDIEPYSINLGSISAKGSIVEETKKHACLRLYNIETENDESLSFIIGAASLLFTKSMKAYRDQLISKKIIKGIVVLRLREKRNTANVAVIVLGENISETWLAVTNNVDSFVEVITEDFSNVQLINHSNKLSASDLDPEYYNRDDQDIVESLNCAYTKELGEIAEVIGCKNANQWDIAETGIPYLRGRDLQNGKIMIPDLFIDQTKANDYSKSLLQEGDILLTKNFGYNKIVLVSEDDLPAIAASGLIIIRAFGVSESYLYNYLTSKTGGEVFKKQLAKIQKGIMQTINLSDLRKLLVPIFDSEIMQLIENESSISRQEAINLSNALSRNITPVSDAETKVYNDLISAGWKKDQFLDYKELRKNNTKIQLTANTLYYPDYLYTMDDGRYILIEIKANIHNIKTEWIERIKAVLNNVKENFLIISTGDYYEIYSAFGEKCLKLNKAPSIEEILKWEKGV